MSVARSTVSDKLTFSGFATDGVAVDSETGAVTVTGLTTGRHIIRVEKNGTATYQVVTARQVSYDLVDADGNVLGEATSLRKWAALPEGGMLRTDMGCCISGTDARFGDTRCEAMEMKVRYLETWEPELKKEFLDKLHGAERLLDESGEPRGMSAEYEALLRRIDFAALLAKRRANIGRLKERIAALDGTRLRFLSVHPEESTLYFPVYLENRGEIQRAMAQRGVYCPVIWPEPEAAHGVCEVSRYVTEHMLALPCDQRYTPEDMDFIADTLIEALEKNT